MIDFNLTPLLPELFMAMMGMALLVAGVSSGTTATPLVCRSAIGTFIIAAFILVWFSWGNAIILSGMFRFDDFAGFMKLIILTGLSLSLLLAPKFLEQEQISRFEYPVLVIFAGIGMMLMVSANNFLSLYMSLELQSLSLYVLAAFHRNSKKSAEAGVKYFTLGALSSGMLLFGISLIYGFTGALDFGAIAATFATLSAIPVGAIFGLVFILAGLAFKISAAPFHMWTPDVYQGAPTSVTALFAIVPKIAAMGLLIRVLFGPFAMLEGQWMQIIYALSIASMIVGAFAALAQNNIKRLLAYSSIGNIGYALIGLVAGTTQGIAAVILYMLLYMITTAGSFAVLMFMRRDGRALEKISDLGGLSRTHPAAAYAMAILMFSMSGIPPMAGFFGKLVVFQAAIHQGYFILAVIGVVSSVIAAYYYLRVVKIMFFDEPERGFDTAFPLGPRIVLGFSTAFIMLFIFQPSFIIATTHVAAESLFAR